MDAKHGDLLGAIRKKKAMDNELIEQLKQAISDFRSLK
jgi:hypothetical protein